MELKKHIELCSKLMVEQIRIINMVEVYGEKRYNFLYGMNEQHGSFKRMFKEIKRVLWQNK